MQEVVTGLSGNVDKLYAEGFHIAGEKYVLTKAEDRSLYARKVGFTILYRVLCIWSNADNYNRAEKASLLSRPHKPSLLPTTKMA